MSNPSINTLTKINFKNKVSTPTSLIIVTIWGLFLIGSIIYNLKKQVDNINDVYYDNNAYTCNKASEKC